MNEELIMNRIIFEDGTMFTSAEFPVEAEPCIFDKKAIINEVNRDVLRITVESTYAEVAAKFVDNAKFAIRQRERIVDDKGNESWMDQDYEKHEYCIAGDIVDHRDGRITVYMGKKNEHELEVEELNGAVDELLLEVLGV